MESSGRRKSGLLTAGGVLSIIAGALQMILGAAALGFMAGGFMWNRYHPFPPMPGMPGNWFDITVYPMLATWITIIGVTALILGIVAIVGGVFALKRKSFGMSLAGAICALPPTVILGVLAIIFVSLSRKEFEPPKQTAGGQGQPGSQQPGGQSGGEQPGGQQGGQSGSQQPGQ